MIDRGKKAGISPKPAIYAAMDRVLDSRNTVGEIVQTEHPFYFRGEILEAGTYRVWIGFDFERDHTWLKVERKGPAEAGPKA